MTGRTALVAGATSGLGLGLAHAYFEHGWRVIATTIEPSPPLEELRIRSRDAVEVHALDITSVGQVEALRQALNGRRIDVVHIVAGVFQENLEPIWKQSDSEILRLLQTNAIAGVRLAELFDALVPEGGVFAFTSSGMGSMSRNVKGDVDLYRISKAALNMLVRSFAARRPDGRRGVLLLCPGWAKTRMGGPDATVEISDSVEGMYRQIVEAKPSAEASFKEYTGAVVPW